MKQVTTTLSKDYLRQHLPAGEWIVASTNPTVVQAHTIHITWIAKEEARLEAIARRAAEIKRNNQDAINILGREDLSVITYKLVGISDTLALTHQGSVTIEEATEIVKHNSGLDVDWITVLSPEL